MKAVVITRSGGPEVLALQDVDPPQVGAGQVLVSVRASGVNRLDILQRMGRYPAPADAPQNIPGVEFAGIVEKIGDRLSEFQPGERVFGLASGGSYAELVAVPERTLARMPGNLSFAEAAAIPEAFITAYDAMVIQGGLAPGETVLINAVGSGVGLAAVQIARAIGARSLGTARRQEKLEKARQFGLNEAILCNDGIFASQVRELTLDVGADVIVELVGGPYVAEDLKCASSRGLIVLVGLLAGASCQIDLQALLLRRLTIQGTVLRSRPLEEKILANQLLVRNLIPLFERKLLQPVIDKVLPLEKTAEAHEYVSGNMGSGKVILSI